MRLRRVLLAGLLSGGVFAALVAGQALAQDELTKLAGTIARIENSLDARVGLLVVESGSDWSFGHRVGERFPMNSTFKALLCGAVLGWADEGKVDLAETIEIDADDILDHAPVTGSRVGNAMRIGELCLATIDMSDNTAANLLIDRVGGPFAVTSFLQGIGDSVTRLDRYEPEMNSFAPDDPRDTTTPAAMVSTLQKLLLGDVFSPMSRAQLRDWMGGGGVTGEMIRAAAPNDWKIADKSGSGAASRSIVAMIAPPDHAPYFVAIYLSEAEVDFEARSAAVIELSAAVIDVLSGH